MALVLVAICAAIGLPHWAQAEEQVGVAARNREVLYQANELGYAESQIYCKIEVV